MRWLFSFPTLAAARGWYDRSNIGKPRQFHHDPVSLDLLKENQWDVNEVGVATAAGLGSNRTDLAPQPDAEASTYFCDRKWEGFHILQRLDETGLAWRLFRDGQNTTSFDIDIASHDPGEFTKIIRQTLKLPALEPYQNELGIFTLDGNRATRVSIRRSDAYTLFVTQNGVWMWPPVRLGFRHDTGYTTSFGKRIFLKTVSMDPVIFEMGQFLSEDEAESIVEQAMPHFKQSPVLKQTTHLGNSHSDFRTSTQAWIGNAKSSAAAEFDMSVEAITRVPRENNEDLQVLRYMEGQFYHAHSDWLDISLYPEQKDVWLNAHYGFADRLATVFAYFTDSPGGHTIFPNIDGRRTGNFKDCETGYKSLCKKGHVAMWYNLLPTGKGDKAATHGGCPPIDGATKFSANKWVRTKPFKGSQKPTWMPSHPRLIAAKLTNKQGEIVKADGSVLADESTEQGDKIYFKNDCGYNLQVDWVSGDDNFVYMMDIAAGSRSSLNTSPGHKFRVAKKGELSLSKVYSAGAGITNFDVTPNDLKEGKDEL